MRSRRCEVGEESRRIPIRYIHLLRVLLFLRSFATRIHSTWWFAPLVFAILTLLACGSTIFSGTRVLASPGTDLTLQFLAWRQFGFGELSHGNLALWNPHIFGGTPYFAGFQSALLYPPNWLHLILPLARAINLLIALHVFGAGYFTYLSCRQRASVVASILAGTMFMLGGPYFLHIYAGHLPHICVIVWIPLILMAIDGIVETGHIKWVILGSIAIAMQVLAGHPQYVYYTGIIATIYAIALSVARRSPKAVGLFGLMYMGGVLLSAVQLFPGISLTRETVRSGGVSYAFAGTFSLPPENFLTLFWPNILGALTPPEPIADWSKFYYGRTYLWESSLFVSVTGAALALHGAIAMADKRLRWVMAASLAACIVLALGRHTPLYGLMYRFVPKYGSFRGTVKFMAPAAALVSMLAAIGFDRLMSARSLRSFAVSTLSAAAVIVMLAVASRYTPLWPRVLASMLTARTGGQDNELFNELKDWAYTNIGFIDVTSRAVSLRLMASAALLIAIAAAIVWRRSLAYVLPVIAAVELTFFTYGARASSPATIELPQAWRDEVSRSPRDSRFIVTEPNFMNAPMYFGFNGVWGYDPGVLKRYAELITFSQGGDASKASQYLQLHQPSANFFRMIRAKSVLLRDAAQPVVQLNPPLPTAVLVRNYSVLTNRDEILRAVDSSAFDPGSSVILETAPPVLPVKGSSIGHVEADAISTDALEIRAEIETPAILLITNNFAEGWHARAMDTGPQAEYVIQPANWAQQAIALKTGKHHFRLEYSPLSFRVGAWVSTISIVGMITSGILVRRKSAATE